MTKSALLIPILWNCVCGCARAQTRPDVTAYRIPVGSEKRPYHERLEPGENGFQFFHPKSHNLVGREIYLGRELVERDLYDPKAELAYTRHGVQKKWYPSGRVEGSVALFPRSSRRNFEALG